MMTIRQVMEIVDGKVLVGEDRLDGRVDTACGELYIHGLPGTKRKTGVQEGV